MRNAAYCNEIRNMRRVIGVPSLCHPSATPAADPCCGEMVSVAVVTRVWIPSALPMALSLPSPSLLLPSWPSMYVIGTSHTLLLLPRYLLLALP